MKNIILLFLLISSPIFIFAFSCSVERSFCDHIQNDYFLNKNGMVCIAESTGNVFYDQPYEPFHGAEMKIIELLYGEIQPGSDQYLNSDSTFWILSLGDGICYEDALNFQNAGEQFVMAPTYDVMSVPVSGQQLTAYSVYLCQRDFYRYNEEMTNITDQLNIVQNCLNRENDVTITCPDNTFLGTFSCLDLDDIPPQINTLEAAMAPPYNIKIEGDIPPEFGVTTIDDGIIFFCDETPRLVTREIIFYYEEFEPPWYGDPEVFATCSFTIETIPYESSIEFLAPPDTEVICGEISTTPPGEVTYVGNDDCFTFDQSNAFFSDQVRVDNNNTSFIRTWQTTDVCGNLSKPQEQIITYTL